MPKFLFNIDPESLEQLRFLSRATGLPVAEFIRRGVGEILQDPCPLGFQVSGHVVSGYVEVQG